VELPRKGAEHAKTRRTVVQATDSVVYDSRNSAPRPCLCCNTRQDCIGLQHLPFPLWRGHMPAASCLSPSAGRMETRPVLSVLRGSNSRTSRCASPVCSEAVQFCRCYRAAAIKSEMLTLGAAGLSVRRAVACPTRAASDCPNPTSAIEYDQARSWAAQSRATEVHPRALGRIGDRGSDKQYPLLRVLQVGGSGP